MAFFYFAMLLSSCTSGPSLRPQDFERKFPAGASGYSFEGFFSFENRTEGSATRLMPGVSSPPEEAVVYRIPFRVVRERSTAFSGLLGEGLHRRLELIPDFNVFQESPSGSFRMKYSIGDENSRSTAGQQLTSSGFRVSDIDLGNFQSPKQLPFFVADIQYGKKTLCAYATRSAGALMNDAKLRRMGFLMNLGKPGECLDPYRMLQSVSQCFQFVDEQSAVVAELEGNRFRLFGEVSPEDRTMLVDVLAQFRTAILFISIVDGYRFEWGPEKKGEKGADFPATVPRPS